MIHAMRDDRCERTMIGWAWDDKSPRDPLVVDIFCDGQHQQRLVANDPRPDLLGMEGCSGWNGFHCQLPRGMSWSSPSMTVSFSSATSIVHRFGFGPDGALVPIDESEDVSTGPVPKSALAAALAVRLGYSSYLEIATPTTGLTFGDIPDQQLDLRHRMMYRCPPDFGDGDEITFRTEAESAADAVALVLAVDPKRRYDLIFLDGWHAYSTSLSDALSAMQLLAPGGALMMHDCFPPSPELVLDSGSAQGWCGETYRAFVDLTRSRRVAAFCTISSDFGCGVLFPEGRLDLPMWTRPREDSIDAELEWARAQGDAASTYRALIRNPVPLLNLVSTGEFLDWCRAV